MYPFFGFSVYICGVKVIRFILALYIVYMAVFPCSDDNTCLDEQKTGIAVATQTDHDHSGSEQDLCTPFCICSCCAAHVQLKDSSRIDGNPTQHNTRLVTFYQAHLVSRTNDAIWQPPRA